MFAAPYSFFPAKISASHYAGSRQEFMEAPLAAIRDDKAFPAGAGQRFDDGVTSAARLVGVSHNTFLFRRCICLVAALIFHQWATSECRHPLGCPTAPDNFQIGYRRPVTDLSVHHKFLLDVHRAFSSTCEAVPPAVTGNWIGVAPSDFQRGHLAS